jgi:hypothetical protein
MAIRDIIKYSFAFMRLKTWLVLPTNVHLSQEVMVVQEEGTDTNKAFVEKPKRRVTLT